MLAVIQQYSKAKRDKAVIPTAVPTVIPSENSNIMLYLVGQWVLSEQRLSHWGLASHVREDDAGLQFSGGR